MIPALVNRFLDYKIVEVGLSENTRDNYGRDLREFCSWLSRERKKAVVNATPCDVRQYLAFCWERKLNPSSVARRISCLRSFFKWLRLDGVIQRDPMFRTALPKQWKRVPPSLSAIEIDTLINSAQRKTSQSQPVCITRIQPALALRDRAICELLYATGMRESEIIGAKLQDLHLAGRVLLVFGKGSKERITPFGRAAAIALENYLNAGRPFLIARKSSPYLFPGRQGEKLTRMRLWQLLNERGKGANLPHVHLHLLRHSCATHMVENGADLRTVQTILGHAEIDTTQRYVKVSQKHLSAIIACCHPRSKPRDQMSLFAPEPILTVPGRMICEECTEFAAPGRKRCERHLRLTAQRSLRSYHKRKQHGSRFENVPCRPAASVTTQQLGTGVVGRSAAVSSGYLALDTLPRLRAGS
jgi:integrase/recombinase XerD